VFFFFFTRKSEIAPNLTEPMITSLPQVNHEGDAARKNEDDWTRIASFNRGAKGVAPLRLIEGRKVSRRHGAGPYG